MNVIFKVVLVLFAANFITACEKEEPTPHVPPFLDGGGSGGGGGNGNGSSFSGTSLETKPVVIPPELFVKEFEADNAGKMEVTQEELNAKFVVENQFDYELVVVEPTRVALLAESGTRLVIQEGNVVGEQKDLKLKTYCLIEKKPGTTPSEYVNNRKLSVLRATEESKQFAHIAIVTKGSIAGIGCSHPFKSNHFTWGDIAEAFKGIIKVQKVSGPRSTVGNQKTTNSEGKCTPELIRAVVGFTTKMVYVHQQMKTDLDEAKMATSALERASILTKISTAIRLAVTDCDDFQQTWGKFSCSASNQTVDNRAIDSLCENIRAEVRILGTN